MPPSKQDAGGCSVCTLRFIDDNIRLGAVLEMDPADHLLIPYFGTNKLLEADANVFFSSPKVSLFLSLFHTVTALQEAL